MRKRRPLHRQTPSQDTFEQLAGETPATLIAWIESQLLRPHHLTYAAEACALVEDPHTVVPTLIGLLRDHPHPAVREGAVYGLAGHMDHPDVIGVLRSCLQTDLVKEIRDAISEQLEDLDARC